MKVNSHSPAGTVLSVLITAEASSAVSAAAAAAAAAAVGVVVAVVVSVVVASAVTLETLDNVTKKQLDEKPVNYNKL